MLETKISLREKPIPQEQPEIQRVPVYIPDRSDDEKEIPVPKPTGNQYDKWNQQVEEKRKNPPGLKMPN